MRWEDNKWSTGKIWKGRSLPNAVNFPAICMRRLSTNYRMSTEHNIPGALFMLLSQGLCVILVT